MNTETSETPETIEPNSSDVLTDDGVTITPTPSRTKTDLFDRSVSWVVAVVALLVVVGIGFTTAFSMGLAAQKHEITSTAYNHAGACVSVQSFMVSGNDWGENPALFAKYQAAHPSETPDNVDCPIPFENNAKR